MQINCFICLLLCWISFNQRGFAIDPSEKLKVGFFLEHLTVRGTEVAVYDYADYNEKLLGNESIVIFVNLHPGLFQSDSPLSVRDYFKARFGSHFYECNTLEEMDQILLKEKVPILYLLKAGDPDGKLSKVAKNSVHAVFPPLQPHGDAYASISPWLSQQAAFHVPYVSHMVHLDATCATLHEELKIPHGSVIFGRHGGFDSFDLNFAQEAVRQTAIQHPDWYFIFLNTLKFCELPNVIFLPATPDLVYKTKFINTCDAMIHAKGLGESFGLACAEFSIKNKPILTWSGLGSPGYQRCHIEILGNQGLYYDDKQSLMNLLSSVGENIQKIRASNWNAYSEKYSPPVVMKKFQEVFISPFLTTELKCQYERASQQPSDINEHIPTLCYLAQECSSVVEIGVKSMVSTWGLLQGLSESSSSRSYLGIDIALPPPNILNLARQLANAHGISFHFLQANDRDIDIESTHMLFIDSLHTYCHLLYELKKFSSKVEKYIVMHDTSWGEVDDPTYRGDYSEYPPEYSRTKRGLWLAIEDFLEQHPEWMLYQRYTNNYGLTILKRR